MQVWGLPKESTEQELHDLLTGVGLTVRSVVFDPRQETQKGKVAFVRFPTPPLPWSDEGKQPDGTPVEQDILKIADEIVANLKAQQPELELHGEKLHCEKTLAEVWRGP